MAPNLSDIDEVMSHLGEFGKYQKMQFLLHILGALTAGLHMMTLVTVAAVPPHFCDVPGFTSNTSLPRPIDSCYYLDTKNQIQECTSWSYDTTYFKSSRGMEWNFVCSRRWMKALAQSMYMFGVFCGAVSLGSMADKYGRKIIFYISSIAQLFFGVSVALIPEYYTFLVFRFCYGIFGSAGAYITGFVLSMELIGASKRTVCGVIFQLCFAIGFMLVSVWGYFIKDRFWLQIIYGLHSALLIGHWWLMDESPRWLWAHNRKAEALAIVQKALRINNTPVILNVQKYTSKVKGQEISVKRAYNATDLFRTPNLRKRTLNVCFNWFANSIVYYGLSLNTGSLVGNPFFMMFLSGLVEIPSYIFLMLVMDRTGRRGLISTLMIIGGLGCIIAVFIPKSISGSGTIITIIVLFGKACISGSFAGIYNYTCELFPTVLRNTALGISAMSARLSGMLTPMIMLLDSLNPIIPATLFGIISILSGYLSLHLPETLNQSLPETLEDGENFGKGDTCFTSCYNRRVKNKQPYEVALQKIDDHEQDKDY